MSAAAAAKSAARSRPNSRPSQPELFRMQEPEGVWMQKGQVAVRVPPSPRTQPLTPPKHRTTQPNPPTEQQPPTYRPSLPSTQPATHLRQPSPPRTQSPRLRWQLKEVPGALLVPPARWRSGKPLQRQPQQPQRRAARRARPPRPRAQR